MRTEGHSCQRSPLRGDEYPARESGAPRPGYARNPLDILCAHRAPVDAVLLDPSGATQSLEVEWMIIELACRPRWVLLVNLNLGGGSGASFVKGRLDMLAASVGGWRLEVYGHFLLHHRPWLNTAEPRRTRAWAVYSRQGA